jgi:glucose/arabinose dehydrogenase
MDTNPSTFFRQRRTQFLGSALAVAAAFSLWACSGASSSLEPEPQAPGGASLSTLRDDFSNPWALARLPDGRSLVTEKAGRMWLLSRDTATRSQLAGVPAVDSAGQGGLLDVAVDPDFAAGQPYVYWSYAERDGTGAGTAVARARLEGDSLSGVTVIFRQLPKTDGTGHYGSRLVFAPDKSLFVTLGERQLNEPAQDLGQHLGKVVRIQRDGSIPPDNPDWGAGARPGLWSIGHRNPQGAAVHPDTGELWVSEHGPQGGDEINIARPGSNYGWPLVSYGCPYGSTVGDACRIGGGTHAPRFVEPLTYWVPISVAPSNLVFYQGSMFPEWRGQILMGSLAGQALWRLTLAGNTVAERSTVLTGDRIRDVDVDVDGSIWMVTDSGKLQRYAR